MQLKEVHKKLHFPVHPYQKGVVNLFLQIEENAISCAIFNNDNTKLHEICSTSFNTTKDNLGNLINELNFFLKDFDVLKHTYNNISVLILNRSFTLVPNAYANNHLKEMLEFNLGINDVKTVLSNKLSSGICFAFTLNLELRSFIEKTFNNAKIKHLGANSIDLFLKLPAFKNETVFLNIHQNLIELIIKKENELLFYNIFKWDSNEDILYFLLFTIEQFDLKPASIKLSVAANMPVSDNLFGLLKKYVRFISYCNSKAINMPVENLPNHFFFNLLNEKLCE